MNLIVNAAITNATSYGIASINLILALERAGINTQTIPIGHRSDFYQEQDLTPSLKRGEEFDLYAPHLRIYHQFDLASHNGYGPTFGFPIFETNAFTQQEIHQLNSVHSLFVCSKWAKDVIKENGIVQNTDIVNLGVDTEVFKPSEPVDGPFTFFFPGKFEYRKGFDILTEVFEKTLTVNDDFRLVLLPTNIFIGNGNNEWAESIMKSKLRDKITILSRLEHHSQVSELYRQSDCVVSFSRAEGWNLPLLEALSCGRHVIATNYSAHTEFLTNDNAMLVEMPDREIAIDGVFFDGKKGVWAKHTEQTINDLADCVRTAYKRGKEINKNGIETAKKFSWDNSAKQIISALAENGCTI